jgi:hypothetical protein
LLGQPFGRQACGQRRQNQKCQWPCFHDVLS